MRGFTVQYQLLCSRRTVEIKTHCPLDGVTGGTACIHDFRDRFWLPFAIFTKPIPGSGY